MVINSFFGPVDPEGGSTTLRNVCIYLPFDTAKDPARLESATPL
jgi:hypothetical protein